MSSDVEADEALIQITSEGGFGPVELILGNGPRYTVLGDGSLIYEGPQAAIFPGPLVPNYQIAQLNDSQLDALLAMVDEMGLAEIDEEVDNDALQFVADATTESVTYWDDQGPHRYGVYALGLEEASSGRNDVFLELIETLDRFTAEAPAEPYEPTTMRIIAGPGFINEESPDVRDWPLESTDLSEWETLPNGWQCQTFDTSELPSFDDATEATVWTHPDQPDPVKLLVRPLLPGEPSCP